MNLEELRSVRNTERQKDSLQELRPSFYQEVGEYIGTLEDERDRLAAESPNPFSSPEVSRLTDEIETAKDVAEAIYERRMGKLVKQASLAAAGMTADADGLTDEEQVLFADLVARIEANKAEILSVLDGDSTDSTDADGTDAPPAPPADEPVDRDDSRPDRDTRPDGVSVADAMGGESIEDEGAGSDDDSSLDGSGDDPPETEGAPDGDDETTDDRTGATGAAIPDEPSSVEDDPSTASSEHTATVDAETDSEIERSESMSADEPDVERVTVQITTDVGSILGVDDREYTLANDDVVTLPEANADPLIERDAAKPLE